MHAKFYEASKKVSPSELQDVIPMPFPMTHPVAGFPGVARYPVDEWQKQGAPCFSTTSWCKLAMLIALNDMENLHLCFDIAKPIKEKVGTKAASNGLAKL